MLPAYYEFNSAPKILSGNNALENLVCELTRLGVSRPLVLTDKTVAAAGRIALFKKGFSDSAMTLGAIVEDVPDPASPKAVADIARVFRTHRCDGIIAVGPDAVMDTAKGIAILVSMEADDILAFAGMELLEHPLVPVTGVPTSPGSGAAVTGTAYFSDPGLNIHMACSSDFLKPAMVLLDPRMILPLSPEDTAAAGMEVLANAMEARMSIRRNPLSDAFADSAIDLVRQYLIKSLQETDDIKLRFAMANASILAGTAFSNAPGGVVHALARAIGCVAGIPRKIAVTCVLPFGLEYNLKPCEAILSSLLLPLSGADEYARVPASRRSMRLLECVRELQKTLKDLGGLPLTLKDAGVSRHALETVAQMAANDPSLLVNPRDMTVPQAGDILNQAYA